MSAIAAVVVTYNPGPEVVENLLRLAEQVGCIVVVDNGSGAASLPVLEAIARQPGARLIRLPDNLGIAAGLNTGIRAALATGAEWVATFDQDSSVTPHYFRDLLAVYALCPAAASVGMVVHRGWSGRVTQILRRMTPVWSFVLAANTSGSLVRREVFQRVGYNDEGLFIDFVDIDFCLRLKQHGFRVLKAMAVALNHELGSRQSRNICGIKIAFRDHAPWRYYYMMRNRLWMYRRYWRVSPLWICADLWWCCYGTAQLCLEHQRRLKIRALLAGFGDALRGRAGRHPEYPPRAATPETVRSA